MSEEIELKQPDTVDILLAHYYEKSQKLRDEMKAVEIRIKLLQELVEEAKMLSPNPQSQPHPLKSPSQS